MQITPTQATRMQPLLINELIFHLIPLHSLSTHIPFPLKAVFSISPVAVHILCSMLPVLQPCLLSPHYFPPTFKDPTQLWLNLHNSVHFLWALHYLVPLAYWITNMVHTFYSNALYSIDWWTFQDTGFGTIFHYPPASNAPKDLQNESSILFSTLQLEAQLEDVCTVFKHRLSTKANKHPQESDEEMMPAPPILPATIKRVQHEHPPEVAPLTISGFTGITMVRLPPQ